MCLALRAGWCCGSVKAFKAERWRAGFYTAGETPALPVTPALLPSPPLSAKLKALPYYKPLMAPQGWHCRDYLPHFDQQVIQFVTLRLHDSVPTKLLEQWQLELGWHHQLSPSSEQAMKLRRRIDCYEDAGHGNCWLARPPIATMVQDTLQHHHNQRYVLMAWCIMPNHVHALIKILPNHSLTNIVHSWKSFTAHQANKLLKRRGKFWQHDYYDRYIRDHDHYQNTINYIHNNPVKAGLVTSPNQWLYSSAYGIG